jgi:hypothetical protein
MTINANITSDACSCPSPFNFFVGWSAQSLTPIGCNSHPRQHYFRDEEERRHGNDTVSDDFCPRNGGVRGAYLYVEIILLHIFSLEGYVVCS